MIFIASFGRGRKLPVKVRQEERMNTGVDGMEHCWRFDARRASVQISCPQIFLNKKIPATP
jgi:hypothetical protein